jgi:ATP-dependent Clp protease adaptor protein ClpS
MSQAAAVAENTAVAEPVEEAQQQRRTADQKPRPLPPHAVVVLNDDEHTFQYVVEVFGKVFGYAPEKCYALAIEIHKQGRGIVWSGQKEIAELKRDLIRSAGADIYASKNVDWPLGVLVEPLPG